MKVKGSAYGAARVRDLLDMTVSLDFVEDYLDTDGDFDRYRRAMLWNPERRGTQPENLDASWLAEAGRRAAGHATIMPRPTPTCSAWSSSAPAACAMPISRRQAVGADGGHRRGVVTVERVGTARAAGGICVTMRDLARLGQLVLDQGRAPSGSR